MLELLQAVFRHLDHDFFHVFYAILYMYDTRYMLIDEACDLHRAQPVLKTAPRFLKCDLWLFLVS